MAFLEGKTKQTSSIAHSELNVPMLLRCSPPVGLCLCSLGNRPPGAKVAGILGRVMYRYPWSWGRSEIWPHCNDSTVSMSLNLHLCKCPQCQQNHLKNHSRPHVIFHGDSSFLGSPARICVVTYDRILWWCRSYGQILSFKILLRPFEVVKK